MKNLLNELQDTTKEMAEKLNQMMTKQKVILNQFKRLHPHRKAKL